jgi:hypothetical protein
MKIFRVTKLSLAFSWSCIGHGETDNPPQPKYPPQKIEIQFLATGLVGTIAKGLEGAQRNRVADKPDLKACYDSGRANGSLFYATQIPAFDWKVLEIGINNRLREKKLRLYKNYGEMITELVSDWNRCLM